MSSNLNFDFSSVFPTEVIKSIATKSGYNEPTLEQWILETYQNKININICKESFSNKQIIKNIPNKYINSVQVKIPFSMCKKEFMTEIFKSCDFERTNSIDEDLINKYIIFCKMNDISSDYTEFILNIPLWDSSTNTFMENKNINYIEENNPFNVSYIILDPKDNSNILLEELQDYKQDLENNLKVIKSFKYPDVEFNNVSKEDNEIATFIAENIGYNGGFLSKISSPNGLEKLDNISKKYCNYVLINDFYYEYNITNHKVVYNGQNINICSVFLFIFTKT